MTLRFFKILLLLFTFSQYSFSQGKYESFFFIQMTDPQFGFLDNNKSFEKETIIYEKAIMEVNRLKPAFVVLTGDLIHKKGDKPQTAEFKRITSGVDPDIPVYYSPGNHDIGQSPTQTDIDEFIRNYGHDRFAFMHDKSLFIGLNSCLIKSNTPGLEQAQYEWLKKKLRKGRKANQVVIFTHYPFFIEKYDEPETYSNIAPDTRNRYLALFRENSVDVVFAGHLHKNGHAKFYGLEMITTSAVGRPLGEAPSGFRIIEVYPDRIESEYFGLDIIP